MRELNNKEEMILNRNKFKNTISANKGVQEKLKEEYDHIWSEERKLKHGRSMKKYWEKILIVVLRWSIQE